MERMAWKTCTSGAAFGKSYLLLTQEDVTLHKTKTSALAAEEEMMHVQAATPPLGRQRDRCDNCPVRLVVHQRHHFHELVVESEEAVDPVVDGKQRCVHPYHRPHGDVVVGQHVEQATGTGLRPWKMLLRIRMPSHRRLRSLCVRLRCGSLTTLSTCVPLVISTIPLRVWTRNVSAQQIKALVIAMHAR